jgi:hypothetical protein
MRTSWLLIGAAVLAAWPASASAQEAECRAVIEKAIEAQGGEKTLAAIKATHVKAKGSIAVMGQDADFNIEIFNNVPDQTKAVIQLSFNNMNFEILNVVDKDKGWASFAGMVKDLEADDIKEAKEQRHVESVTNLIALKDKAFQLAPLGESKVGETPVVGIQVSKKDHRDVNLFFDKKTHRLLKAEYRAIEPIMKQEVNQEKFYSEFKELVPGATMASHFLIKNDGNKFMEMDITELRSVDRHDASVFAKPK